MIVDFLQRLDQTLQASIAVSRAVTGLVPALSEVGPIADPDEQAEHEMAKTMGNASQVAAN